MKFAMSAPNRGALASAANLRVIAGKAEALGYEEFASNVMPLVD